MTLKLKSSPISSVVPILSAAKLVGVSKLFVEIIQYIKSYCLLFYCHKKLKNCQFMLTKVLPNSLVVFMLLKLVFVKIPLT